MNKNFAHGVVKHGIGEYVRGDFYTNTIDGAFGHFKRPIIGAHHKASDKHINRYLDMFAWRWPRRKNGEGEHVNAMLKATMGSKLLYKALINKD